MNSISFQYTLDKVGLPLIVTSNKPNLCFLIDTGATHNIVFSYVYEKFSHIFKPIHYSTVVMGIDGLLKETHQVACTLTFEDKEADSVLSVLDANSAVLQVQRENGVQIHGILGVAFLTQNKWIIDFKNLTLQC